MFAPLRRKLVLNSSSDLCPWMFRSCLLNSAWRWFFFPLALQVILKGYQQSVQCRLMVVNSILGFFAWWGVKIFYAATPGFIEQIVGETLHPCPCGLPSNFRAIYSPVYLCRALSGRIFHVAERLWLRGCFLFSGVLDAFKNENKISSFQPQKTETWPVSDDWLGFNNFTKHELK